MKTCFRNSLSLVVSILFHLAAVLLLAPAFPEIGKNTSVLAYPVRVRLVGITLAQASDVSTVPQAGPSFIKVISSPPSASTRTEGRLERSQKIYIESSNRYFTPTELDSRPAVIALPDLGIMNISATTEGEAILRLFINESGAVDRIDIERSTLPEMMLEQLQLQRDQLRFTPGNKNGINVKSAIFYKIELASEATVKTIDSSGELPR